MEKHLQAEDFIKYLDTEESSEDYLQWMSKVQEHLADCELCQERLQRVLAVDLLDQEEIFAEGLSLLQKESDIRQKLLAEQLLKCDSHRRTAAFAQELREGHAWNKAVRQREFFYVRPEQPANPGHVVHRHLSYYTEHTNHSSKDWENRSLEEIRGVEVRWKDGVIRVEIWAEAGKNFLVILVPETTEKKFFYGSAIYNPGIRRACVEFLAERPTEDYRVYVKMVKK